jgi:hypothetical protein
MNLLEQLLSNFLSVVPNVVGALLVFLVGYILARMVAKVLSILFSKMGVDKLADKLNDIDMVQQYNLKISFSLIIAKVFYYLILMFTLVAAAETLGMPAISKLISDIITYIPNLLIAIVILNFGLLLANAIKGMVLATCKSLAIPSAGLIANFVFYFVLLTVGISALGQAKVDTDFVKNNLSIILGGGVAAFSIAYGLASRDVMSNFLGSMYSRRRFREGDVIRVGDVVGRIAAMDNTSVILNAPDKQIVIPLSKLMRETVEILPNDFLQLPNE